MTLENTLIKSLSEWRPDSRATLAVKEKDSPWTVQVTADRCELLGAQVWELAVARAGAPEGLKMVDWAQRIATNTSGLQEPLRVLEIDEQMQQALLRSEAPVERDGKVSYYEVQVKGTTGATLQRFQANRDSTTRREQIAFVLTHETIARVVAGLTA
jgi:hypothetical protein